MKKLFYFLFILFFISCSQNQQTDGKSTSADITTQTATIILNSLVCNSCIKTITEAVNKIEGVKTITIDLDKKNAFVTFLPSKTSLVVIEKTITDAGYNANDKKRNEDAFNNLDECCKIK